MKKTDKKYRILVLGASGYLGSSIYKELCSYYDTYGTFFRSKKEYEKNSHFFQYNIEEDDIYEILEATKPGIIVSALRGDFHAQTIAHVHLTEYALEHNSKIIFLSSANAFDAYSKYPSYETDKTLSHSIYGHFKIKIENMLMRMPKKQYAILRLPMVFGNNCPRILEIKQLVSEKEAVELFPNLIMNVTLNKKVTQQIHYIINRSKSGVFHLGSTDLVHHDEFIQELTSHLFSQKIAFKNVYTTNDERYLAVLPKYNVLPKHLQITSDKVLEELKK